MIREERFCAEMVERVQSAQEEAEARGWGLASPSPGYKGREHSRPESQLLQCGGNGRQWHQRGESFLLAMFRVAQCVPSPKPQFHHLSDDEDTQWEVLLA